MSILETLSKVTAKLNVVLVTCDRLIFDTVGTITKIVGAAVGIEVGDITVFNTKASILVVAESILDSNEDDDVREIINDPVLIAVSIWLLKEAYATDPLLVPNLSSAREIFQATATVAVDLTPISWFILIVSTTASWEEVELYDMLIIPISLARTPAMDLAMDAMKFVFTASKLSIEFSKPDKVVREAKFMTS